MSNAIYSRLAKTASKLIRKYGAEVPLTRVTLGAYDPATGPAATTTTSVTPMGLVSDWKTDESDTRQNQQSISGSNANVVQSNDKKVILESTYAPTLDDKLTIGGAVHSIVPPIRTVGPAGTAIIYIVRARAG